MDLTLLSLSIKVFEFKFSLLHFILVLGLRETRITKKVSDLFYENSVCKRMGERAPSSVPESSTQERMHVREQEGGIQSMPSLP